MNCEKAFAFETNEVLVELRFTEGTCLSVDRRGAEAGVFRMNWDQMALDMLVYYNDPFAYVQLMLYGDTDKWIKVTNR